MQELGGYAMSNIFCLLASTVKRVWNRVRFGKITEKIVGTVGDNEPAEIEYFGRRGKLIGFWAYGSWHPDYPYQGLGKTSSGGLGV